MQDAQVEAAIISFFQQNPYPSDRQVHQLAKQLGINAHQFEQHIYAVLTELLQQRNVGQPPWAPRWGRRMGGGLGPNPDCPYRQNLVGRFLAPPRLL